MANAASDEGIRIEFIGDSGPFSRTGKSIGYRISVKNSSYLLDMGGPVFHQPVGHEGIREMKGVFATHSHEDHRRWFTDVALYMYYMPDIKNKLRLITTEIVHEEWFKNSRAALERSLSADQKRVVEIPYAEFVEPILMGPRAKYRIEMVKILPEPGAQTWRVVNKYNEVVDPSIAKVVVHPYGSRPRMLFKDPVIGEWVEPETFYSLKDSRFYEDEQNPFEEPEAELTVRPIKSLAWHGPPTYGMEFTTPTERVLFSSDTVYDPELWQSLVYEHHEQKLPFNLREFERTYILIGNINDYIERTWSVERLNEALAAYNSGLVVHDVDYDGSIVHTSYSKLRDSGFKNLFLTHSPDDFVSELPLARERKAFRVLGGELFEEVNGSLYPYRGDLFIKRYSQFFVGFKNPQGKYSLYKQGNRLRVQLPGDPPVEGTPLGNYDLYADIDGKYYPPLEDLDARYIRRPDGRVDRITYTPEGCVGMAIDNLREKLVPPVSSGASHSMTLPTTSGAKTGADNAHPLKEQVAAGVRD